MLTGQFTSYPIDQITVDRAARQRRELTGIAELAQSLATTGQINPIIIERDGNLRAGERRFEAAKRLGWTHLLVQFVDELSEVEFQKLELAENVQRAGLAWQDECRAVAHYHALCLSQDKTWTRDQTAAALNMSRPTVYEKILVAQQLDSGNVMVAEAPKLSTAIGIAQRAVERKRDSVLAEIAPALTEKKEPPIICADFDEWQRTYDGPLFNFIHCDFPYGVNADKHDQGAATSFGGYADTEEVYWKLMNTLEAAMANVIAPSAHLMFWFSMDYYQETLKRLSEMGWFVNIFPLIWYKSDNTGILPDPTRGPRRIYETCFIASRGDRKIVRAVSNVVAAPVTKITHMSEKNLTMLSKFMEMFVDENTIMLDPTCGSANAIKAALRRGAHSALGLELSPEFTQRAKEHFYDDDEIPF